MLLEIQEFIAKTEKKIGSNAKVTVTAGEDYLEIRVDWWERDFRLAHRFTKTEIYHSLDEALVIDRFVDYCHKIIDSPQGPRKNKTCPVCGGYAYHHHLGCNIYP